MTLEALKEHLGKLDKIAFQLPNQSLVPSHFHVTEVGKVTKNFIDCGGKLRNESVVSLQLWEENDYDHRLHPEKLVHILNLAQQKLGIENLEVEVEYQGDTIGKYNLDFDGTNFLLVTKKTACLAKEACGVPETKGASLNVVNDCGPGSSCC